MRFLVLAALVALAHASHHSGSDSWDGSAADQGELRGGSATWGQAALNSEEREAYGLAKAGTAVANWEADVGDDMYDPKDVYQGAALSCKNCVIGGARCNAPAICANEDYSDQDSCEENGYRWRSDNPCSGITDRLPYGGTQAACENTGIWERVDKLFNAADKNNDGFADTWDELTSSAKDVLYEKCTWNANCYNIPRRCLRCKELYDCVKNFNILFYNTFAGTGDFEGLGTTEGQGEVASETSWIARQEGSLEPKLREIFIINREQVACSEVTDLWEQACPSHWDWMVPQNCDSQRSFPTISFKNPYARSDWSEREKGVGDYFCQVQDMNTCQEYFACDNFLQQAAEAYPCIWCWLGPLLAILVIVIVVVVFGGKMAMTKKANAKSAPAAENEPLNETGDREIMLTAKPTPGVEEPGSGPPPAPGSVEREEAAQGNQTWQKMTDEKTGREYYWNTKTETAEWTKPEDYDGPEGE